MPVRIRFTGPATLNATLTISWAGGYPPGATATAVETFKTNRAANYQTTISSNPTTQAANYLAAITQDYGANFVATQVGNDVIITPRNGTQNITASTTSSNITINPSVADIQVTARSQEITPVYNPVVTKFFSSNYAQPGFRYLVDVVNLRDDSLISSFKVAPIQDGTGYIDISKPLSNVVSVDFSGAASPSYNSDQANSYVDYEIQLGEEYQFNWPFNSISEYGGTGPYATKTRLTNSLVTAHSYSLNDQINISTYPDGTSGSLTGLHRVVAIPSASSIVVDVTYPGATAAGASGGVTSFADGRKTAFRDVASLTGLAFNGAVEFRKLRNFFGSNYNIFDSAEEARVLSSILDGTSEVFGTEDWYMTASQFMDINIIIDPQSYGEYTCIWKYLDRQGNVIDQGSNSIGTPSGSATSGKIRNFRVGFNDLVGSMDPQGYALKFYIIEDTSSTQVSRGYYIYQDNRCEIEPYVINFMDRFGSIMSYAFPLRSKESGKIERSTYNKTITYNPTSHNYTNIYPTTVAGDTTYSVNVKKELELNTNWMTDYMSVAFEELLTSPYAWINFGDGQWWACTVQETAFETERQKNKNLIRKTVKVRLANENVINI